MQLCPLFPNYEYIFVAALFLPVLAACKRVWLTPPALPGRCARHTEFTEARITGRKRVPRRFKRVGLTQNLVRRMYAAVSASFFNDANCIFIMNAQSPWRAFGRAEMS